MDQPQDLASLLAHLQSILSSQNLLNSSGSSNNNDPSSLTPPPAPVTAPPILPSSIPPLPSTCLTLPTHTSPLSTTTTLLKTHILPHLNLASLSPNYYGFIIGGTTPAALLADWLVSVYDQNVHVHLPSESISTTLEAAALNLLVQLFRLPEPEWGIGGPGNGGGLVTTGATASNVLGLAVGREWVVGEAARRRRGKEGVSVAELGVLRACREAGVTEIEVVSSLPHVSVLKAAAVVGIGRDCVRVVGRADDPVLLDVDRLEAMAAAMVDEGKVYILAVSAGELNSGRFATESAQTWMRIRRICDTYGIWIHVDGAFGLFGRVLMNLDTESQREYEGVITGVQGVELADSITGDGHKLLNVPYDCGLFFTRHKMLNEKVFGNPGVTYSAKDTPHAYVPGENDPRVMIQSPLNIGIENSRRFRALPIWTTLMTYGKEGYVELLRRQIGLARKVVEWMWDDERVDVLPTGTSKEVALSQTFMIVLFRARDQNANVELAKRINATKRMYVTSTTFDGRPAARLAVSNWQVNIDRDAALIGDVISECLG